MNRKSLPVAAAVLMSIVFVLPAGNVSLASELGSELQSVLESSRPGEQIPIIVTLKNNVNLALFTDEDKKVRRHRLVQALKSQAELKHKPLRELLESRGVSNIQTLWIINGLAIKAPPAVIGEIAEQSEVETIRLDRVVTVPKVTSGTPVTPEWNLNAVHAPDLWNLGYTGKGVVVANMDTGVDLDHPDLKNKWRGGTNSWFDPYGQTSTPYDPNGHGTQTMGIIAGGSAGGTAIGVAPDATWIAVKIYDDNGQSQVSVIHQGFQWLLNPDKNSATDDAPDVVNNSWDWENNGDPCNLEFENDIQVLEQAGIAVVFAAGNSGPLSSTSLSPANNPRSFSVGATDEGTVIADFSSRGPSACDGTVFPRVVAPGVNVKTADLSYGGVVPEPFSFVSGTSFSSPHVAGAIALLLSAFPNSKVADLKTSLATSAMDLGTKGPDNTYGNGLLDVSHAYAILNGGQTASISAVDDAYAVKRNRVLGVDAPGVLGNDQGSEVLKAVLSKRPLHGVVVFHADGSFRYLPFFGYTGTDKFTYKARAGNGGYSNAATVTISIKPSSRDHNTWHELKQWVLSRVSLRS